MFAGIEVFKTHLQAGNTNWISANAATVQARGRQRGCFHRPSHVVGPNRRVGPRLLLRSIEPSAGVQLLAALRAMFTKNRTEISSEQAVQEFLADPNSPWHEYRGRGPITKNQVAALLRDYDIRPVVLHPTKRADFSRHGYRAAHFEDAFARFLPHEPNIRTLKRGREGM